MGMCVWNIHMHTQIYKYEYIWIYIYLEFVVIGMCISFIQDDGLKSQYPWEED